MFRRRRQTSPPTNSLFPLDFIISVWSRKINGQATADKTVFPKSFSDYLIFANKIESVYDCY